VVLNKLAHPVDAGVVMEMDTTGAVQEFVATQHKRPGPYQVSTGSTAAMATRDETAFCCTVFTLSELCKL
jgi:hypothetical protein